jgi:glycerol-3-phosphate acyltransferase PlsY
MTPIETPILILILWAIVGYTMGSVPFGIVLSRLMGLGDLRKLGSGNIGATNVLRTGNKTAAALTVVLDAGKGTAAVMLASAMSGEDAAQLAGLAALIGHCFTIFLKFKGGKGTATFLGVMLGLSFPLGLACCASWLATAYFLRISSLSALVAAAFITAMGANIWPSADGRPLRCTGVIGVRTPPSQHLSPKSRNRTKNRSEIASAKNSFQTRSIKVIIFSAQSCGCDSGIICDASAISTVVL